jgi:hypothetical protein
VVDQRARETGPLDELEEGLLERRSGRGGWPVEEAVRLGLGDELPHDGLGGGSLDFA